MPFQTILVAVDESPISAHAADVAEQLANKLGARLGFVFVVDAALGIGAEGIPIDALLDEEKQRGVELVSTFAARARTSPPPFEVVMLGKPADEIVEAARKWNADLLVIGSHGRSGIGRALLGSVAERVSRHAHCPVLIVRPPE